MADQDSTTEKPPGRRSESSSSEPSTASPTSSSSAKVLFPYKATLPDELTLREGDHITNIEWVKVGGVWAGGTCQGKTGLFHPFCVQSYDPILENLQKLRSLSRGRGNPEGHQASYMDHSYIFTKKPEDWYVCGICMELASDPTQTSCCGQTYCNQCVSKWAKKKTTCPQCRAVGFSFSADVRTERFIKNLELFCPNYSQGCDWNSTLRSLSEHISNDCRYAIVSCPNGCGKTYQRFAEKVHTGNECILRKIPCPFCSRCLVEPPLLPYQQMTSVHYKECPYWPMRCPNHCEDGHLLQRNTLEDHRRHDCPKETIDCHFEEFGCSYKTKRENMVEHLKEEVHVHLNMVASSYRNLKVELEELKRQQGVPTDGFSSLSNHRQK